MSRFIIIGGSFVIGIILMSASCRNSNGNEVEVVQAPIEGAVDGMVTMKFEGDGCALLISVMEYGNEVFYIPVALDDKYKVEGMKISFTYISSRINQGNCFKGHPIVIERIQSR